MSADHDDSRIHPIEFGDGLFEFPVDWSLPGNQTAGGNRGPVLIEGSFSRFRGFGMTGEIQIVKNGLSIPIRAAPLSMILIC